MSKRVQCQNDLIPCRSHGPQGRVPSLSDVAAASGNDGDLAATQVLSVKNMTAGGGARKKGPNREILATSPALFLHMLRAKAEEAGLKVPTRTVKPSQTCSACGWQERKPLAQRVHRCACGTVLGRDENAARVMLHWVLGASGREPARWRGTAEAVVSKHETPPGTPAQVE